MDERPCQSGVALNRETLAQITAEAPAAQVAWSINTPRGKIWIKRTAGRSAWISHLRAWLFIPFGWLMSRGLCRAPAVDTGDDGIEAARLRIYRSKGLAVPCVIASTPNAIALEDVGVALRSHLNETPDEDARWALISQAMDELIGFHARGEWHGGAQLKNMTIDADGQLHRIDFEEPFGGRMATAFLQVYDLVLFLTSAERYLDDDHLTRLAQRWLDSRAKPQIEVAYLRAMNVMQTLRMFPVLRIAAREYRRLSSATTAMDRAWQHMSRLGQITLHRPRIALRWRAVALSLCLVLVSDELFDFVTDYDEPHEIQQIHPTDPAEIDLTA